MKIRILEVSEKSAHYGRPYDLRGTTGDVLAKNEEKDGSTYMALSDLTYPADFPLRDEIDNRLLILFVKRYEVVEDGG